MCTPRLDCGGQRREGERRRRLHGVSSFDPRVRAALAPFLRPCLRDGQPWIDKRCECVCVLVVLYFLLFCFVLFSSDRFNLFLRRLSSPFVTAARIQSQRRRYRYILPVWLCLACLAFHWKLFVSPAREGSLSVYSCPHSGSTHRFLLHQCAAHLDRGARKIYKKANTAIACN